MRKLSLGFVGLLIAGAIYYFTTGASQIAAKIKKQVNQELTLASANGFAVEERKETKKSEHFILSFDDTVKIAHFLNTQGIHVQARDVANLKGLKLGVDMTYLHDAYSAVSLEIYPLNLPNSVHTTAQTPEDKKMLTQMDAMLKKKAILVHIDVNKIANGFKGYVKDINETFTANENVHFILKGMTFKGDLKDKTPQNIIQHAKEVTLSLANKITITLQALQSKYVKTGVTTYDYKTNNTIEKISLKTNEGFLAQANHLTFSATSNVKNNLASGTTTSMIQTISLGEQNQTTIIDTLTINTDVSNLDITALNKLKKTAPNNQAENLNVLQQLLSKGVIVNISDASVKNIRHKQQALGGLTLNAHADISKSFNIKASQKNPLSTLDALNANLKVSLDKTLFSFIAKQPKAMMAMMLFQPKDVQDKKVYSVEIKNGKILVNGMPVM